MSTRSRYTLCLVALMFTRVGTAQRRRAPRRRPAAVRVVREANVCVPGAQFSCDSVSGSGVQFCNERGSGLGPCEGSATSLEGTARTNLSHVVAPMVDPVAVREQRHWYGWQVLLVDLGALALSSAALGSGSTALTYVAGGIQLFVPPIVHWSHGRVGAGFSSMGIRLAFPLMGTLAAYSATNCTFTNVGNPSLPVREDCSPRVTAMVIGLGIGQIIASIVDIASLSYESTSPPAAQRTPRGPQWSASIVPTAHGLEMGVVGSF